MSGSKKVHRWSDDRVEVSWDERLCIHAAECTRAKGELFESGRSPWCRPELAGLDELAEVIERCPSGALAYARRDAGGDEEPPTSNSVAVTSRGPLYFRGELQIDEAEDDQPGLRTRAAMCRCGASENKPFCDGSHEKSGFDDYGAVGETGEPLDEEGGPITFQVAKGGPLVARGNLRVHAASGREAWSGRLAAFCRCGQSSNKPFCDGSHKEAGFERD